MLGSTLWRPTSERDSTPSKIDQLGTSAPFIYHLRLPDLPYTPGTDAAGDVERVGKNVSTVKVNI